MNQNNLNVVDWSVIPKPEDDGKAKHLTGSKLPDITLKSTNNEDVNLSELGGMTVLFAYPMTGRPDVQLPDGWDQIPGARGCTPQSCSFRDSYAEIQNLGVQNLFGLSTQDTEYQKEAVERLHLPYQMLSDNKLKFTKALNMPTMEVNGMTLNKRITFVINQGVIQKTFYPVFPPDKNVDDVIEYLNHQ